MAKPTFIFIPTPGDHYSLATGSAIMSVVHEIVRKHIAAGGEARIIVGAGTRHDIEDGQCVEVNYPPPGTRNKKLADAALGRIGLPRHFERQLYRPVLNAIEPDFDGPIFVYNSPGVMGLIKNHRPKATVCLYAVNALFRTYSHAEVRRVVAQADRVICCSHFIANDILMRLGQASPKVQVVHNGVDTTRFQPSAARHTNGQPVKILFIGRVVPQKGPDLLLKAARLLHGKVPPFKMRLVGNKNFAIITDLSPYERELRNLAEPISDAVEFHPSISRDQLLQEYQSADIFCAPSNWDDPFPLTVLESMACGVPTVASRRGGIPEGGAEDILYFLPPNAEELAQKLALLIRDASERAQWGAKARARSLTFDWENQYRKLCQAVGAA
jgi:glycosyltransferase involved in cell wall biosynthesis